MSELAGLPISRAILNVPAAGSWRLHAVLASGDPLTERTKVTATIQGFELRGGTVVQSGFNAPGTPSATVVGGAGWDRELTMPIAFRSDAGVRLSTVLRELATRAGEPIEQPRDATLGIHFVFPASRAGQPVRLRDILASLFRLGTVAPWRVDPDGVTRFGPRPPVAVSSRALRLWRDAATGQGLFGIDRPGDFLPGALLEDKPIVRLVVRDEPRQLTAEVWQP